MTGPTPVTLSQLRRALGASQQEVASQLGVSQPAVLKLERSSDPQLSTVRRYVEALGRSAGKTAAVELAAVVDGERYLIVTSLSDEGEQTMTMTAELAVPTASLTASLTAWRLRAWDDPDLEARFLNENVVAISDDRLGDLTDWPSDAELRLRLSTANPDRGDQAIGTFARYWKSFRIDMKPGDAIIVPLARRRAAIGVISGDYEYRGHALEKKMRHVRPVRWLRVVERSALDEQIRKVVNAPGTIARIHASGAAAILLG